MPTSAKNMASNIGRMISCAAHRVNATASMASTTSDIGARGRGGGGTGTGRGASAGEVAGTLMQVARWRGDALLGNPGACGVVENR
ncbi:hypothetical protein D9M72_621070 [compost metagenome]